MRGADTFFSTTPQDLIDDGLYKTIATALHPMPFREVSLALAAQASYLYSLAKTARLTQASHAEKSSLCPTSAHTCLQVCGAMPSKRANRKGAQKQAEVNAEKSVDVLLTQLEQQAQANDMSPVGLAATCARSRAQAPKCEAPSATGLGDELWPGGPAAQTSAHDAVGRLQSAVRKVQTVQYVQRARKRTPQRTGLVEGFHAVVPDGLPPEGAAGVTRPRTTRGRLEVRQIPSLTV